MKNKVWGLVVGHDRFKPGAMSYSYPTHTHGIDITTEYQYWLERFHNIRNRLTQYGVESHVITRDPEKTYRDQCKQVASDCSNKGVTDTIHGHFNSSLARAKGIEVLVLKGDQYAHEKADIITDMFSNNLGFKERHGDGVKEIVPGHNGYHMLKEVSKVASPILLEPTFANWEHEESRILLEKPWLIENQIHHFIMEETCNPLEL